jgi:drug/metabolite transporter (DMT)-like permease
VLRDASPFALLFVDSVLTTLLLLPFLFIEKGAVFSIAESSWRVRLLIILSLALAALANFFIFSSIKILGASTASVFEIAYPFFVVLFTSQAWYRSHHHRQERRLEAEH